MSILKFKKPDGTWESIAAIKGEPGKDGAIQYTAGEGITIENDTISAEVTKQYVDDSVATLSDYVDEQLANAGGMNEEQVLEILRTKGFIIIDQDMKGCEWQVVSNAIVDGRPKYMRSRQRNTEALEDFMSRLNSTMVDLKTKGYTDAEIRQKLVIVLRDVYYNQNNVTVKGTFIAYSDDVTSLNSTVLTLSGDMRSVGISNSSLKSSCMAYPYITLYYGGDYFNDSIFDINFRHFYTVEQTKTMVNDSITAAIKTTLGGSY